MIIFQAKYLYHLASFASKEETRYYLKGVYIGRHPGGGAVLAATDGHKLGMYHDQEAIIEDDSILSLDGTKETLVSGIILPTNKQDFIKQCRGLVRDEHNRWVVYDPEKGILYVVFGDSPQEAKQAIDSPHEKHRQLLDPIEGTFPDFLRIIPDKISQKGEISWFNADYLSKFAPPHGSKSKPITLCGTLDQATGEVCPTSAYVIFNDDPNFLGLCMPMRGDQKHTLPAFVDEIRNPGSVKKAA